MPLQFPFRDLTNQYISLSYQDVVQRYSQGTSSYFLDGLGNVIAFIPTSSIGQQILTVDQTASFADHSTTSDTSSVSLVAIFSDTASLAFESVFADTASLAVYANYAGSSSYAISSSHALIADVALNVPITASNADTASFSFSASHSSVSDFALTASFAYTSSYEMETEISSSWASASLSSSHALISDIALNVPETASNANTASFAFNAVSASYAPFMDNTNAVSASWVSASNLINSSSYSTTASYVNSASFSTNSANAYAISFVPAAATSASWASSSVSSSFATDAGNAYAINFVPSAAVSASWVSASTHIVNADSASYLSGSFAIVNQITASSISASGNVFVGGNVISNQLTASNISASGNVIAVSFTGSLLGTASVSLNSISSSISNTASYSVITTNANSSSYPWVTSGSNIYNGNTGNVGIGIATPVGNLDVYGAGNNSQLKVYNSDAASLKTASIYIGNNSTTAQGLQFSYISHTDSAYIDNIYTGAKLFLRTSTSGTPKNALTLLADGTVGVNTTVPTTALQVNGTISSSNNTSVNGYTAGSTQIADASGNLFGTSLNVNAGAMTVNSAGATKLTNITASGNISSSNTIIGNTGSFNIVGIGTTTPSSELNVVGNINVDDRELITNGSFTSNTTGWTVFGGAGTVASVAGGQTGNCAQVTNVGSGQTQVYQGVTVISGSVYQLTFWHKSGTAPGYFTIGNNVGSIEWYASPSMVDGGWTSRTARFTPNVTTVYVVFWTNDATDTHTTFFDDISVKKVNSGVISINGIGNNYFADAVGIGLTNPVNKLDVAGNISCSVITASVITGVNGTFSGTISSSNNNSTNGYTAGSTQIADSSGNLFGTSLNINAGAATISSTGATKTLNLTASSWSDNNTNTITTYAGRQTVRKSTAGVTQFGIAPNTTQGADNAAFFVFGKDYSGVTNDWWALVFDTFGDSGPSGDPWPTTNMANTAVIGIINNNAGGDSLLNHDLVFVAGVGYGNTAEVLRFHPAQNHPTASFFANKVTIYDNGNITCSAVKATSFTGSLSSSVVGTQGFTAGIKSITTNYTASSIDYTILCKATASIEINLPSTTANGQIFNIKNATSQSFGITVTPTSPALIDNQSSWVINSAYNSMELQYDGTNWWII